MATLFISFQHEDDALARGLELRLRSDGHTFKIPVGTNLGAEWRSKQMSALEASDVVLFILSERGLRSAYVLGQLGASRIYEKLKHQLMLPILVGVSEVPKFVNDLHCFELPVQRDKDIDRLSVELEDAIREHSRKYPKPPRIFISHRHIDEPMAAALISVLEAAFTISKSDIRCTSVQPYALPPGERVSDRLRNDINGAELVLGLIGPEVSESQYVLFELGASWSRGAPTFPVLVRGAKASDVPGPLGERHSVSLEDDGSCHQLIDDIETETSLGRKQGVSGRVADEIKRLTAAATSGKIPEREIEDPPQPRLPAGWMLKEDEVRRMAQHISNYLNENDYTMMSFERVRSNVNENYSNEAMRELIERLPDRFRRATLAGGLPGIARLRHSS